MVTRTRTSKSSATPTRTGTRLWSSEFEYVWGSRRFETDDDSRNNFWLALLTLGEGWHNNHHHYPSSARQGFLWWEIDLSYYGLVVLSWLGLIRDLRAVPAHVRMQTGEER